MSNTLRKLADVVNLYPDFIEARRQNSDPLDLKLSVIRAINWELSKLESDDDVLDCMEFLMKHRGFERRAPENEK